MNCGFLITSIPLYEHFWHQLKGRIWVSGKNHLKIGNNCMLVHNEFWACRVKYVVLITHWDAGINTNCIPEIKLFWVSEKKATSRKTFINEILSYSFVKINA